jgi:hypothetical protein
MKNPIMNKINKHPAFNDCKKHPSLGPSFFLLIGAPQIGQFSALSDISLLHSGQFIKAIYCLFN